MNIEIIKRLKKNNEQMKEKQIKTRKLKEERKTYSKR